MSNGSDRHVDNETDISLTEVLAILRRRKGVILASVAAGVAAAYGVSQALPQKWAAEAQMILLPDNTESSRWISAPESESVDTQAAMLESPAMYQRTLDRLGHNAPSPAAAFLSLTPEELGRLVRIAHPKGTDLVTVTVTTPERNASVAIANALCNSFIDWKRELARSRSDESIRNLAARTKTARADLAAKERRLTLVMRQGGVVEMGTQNRALLQQLASRSNEVSALEQELSAARQREAGLRAQAQHVNQMIRQSGAVRDDALVTSLQSQLQQLEMERAAAARKYTAAYPGVLPELDGKIAEVKTRLSAALQGSVDGSRPSLSTQKQLQDALNEVRLQIATTASRLQTARGQQAQLSSVSATQPARIASYDHLSQEVGLARSTYAGLAERLNALQAGRDMITSDVRITQPATLPDKPKFPRLNLNLALGALLGLFGSVLAALLLEQSDRRLHTSDAVTRLIPGPVIGMVPQFGRAEMHRLTAGSNDTSSYAADAFGLASANLSLLWRGEATRPRVIMLTSAVPGEGKSTAAAQIARSMARTTQRVVLIDADMRRPTQTGNFRKETPGPGLADILEGRATVDGALMSSSVPGLSVLHSGGPVGDAAALIASPRFAEVLKTLVQEGYTILVDTPAGAVVPDAVLMAPHADCIVQVVGVGTVDAEAVNGVLKAMQAAGARHLAFLVNRVPRDRARERRYRSTYGKSAYRRNEPALEATH